MCGKAMAHLCIQSVKITPELVNEKFWHEEFQRTRSRFIREAFMACRAAYHQFKKTPSNQDVVRLKYQASARTALRAMVVHGMDHHLSRPNNENLIWKGDLCWSHIKGDKPDCQDFDWLVDYLADETENDKADETENDKADETSYALLALSAMRGLGSSPKRRSYIMSLIRCMGYTRPRRVRHAALRAICEAQEELAPIAKDSMPQGVDAKLMNKLACALLTAVRPNHDQTFNDGGLDAYIRLIYVLTKHDEWCQRLTQDCHSHLPLCISLAGEVSEIYDRDVGFYLAVIIGRINPLSKDLPSSPPQGDFWQLIKDTWQHARNCASLGNDDYVGGIPALVTATRLTFPGSYNTVPRKDVAKQVRWALDDLQRKQVRWALDDLQRRKATLVDSGIAQTTVDDAISSVQGYLGEDQSAPQEGGGNLGS
ncbi:hypothetical protein DEU56DRAFT_782538 [Suillus clintonianus]|uniref:uncharacterized protein n=1 Tax=Suillus clintonianus TaxID=1904413 RepID=UPI001B86BFD4|nr:uncharacterized protein DEU56DRAFT_782538 [Suillus clintonianus]KAG2148859.1 hypothetical protein DEU56DRAFT_782538 [Suillus clintonianus]